MIWRTIVVIQFILSIAPKVMAQDSTASHGVCSFKRNITFSNNFSASYVNYKNWKYNGYNNFSFLLRSGWSYDTLGKNREAHVRLTAEVGYMKFTDSIWYKSSDYWDLSSEVLKNSGKRFESVFSFYCSSQFLSVYEDLVNDSGIVSKQWVSGFGNPMNIDIGYGTSIHFWKNSRVSLTFITLRTSTSPIMDGTSLNEGEGYVYKGALIRSEYGLGLQTQIRKSFGKRIRWENNSRFFGNAIHRKKLDLDVRNRFIVKIFRYLDFIIDSKIRYVPLVPYKFQFRNELMLSFTFEKM